MQDIPIEGFTYEQRSFGYTVSVWLRNYGQHTYSLGNVERGLAEHKFLEIKDSFAMWMDSQDSFRIYVFSVRDYEEVQSDSIYLPMNEWINV